MTGAVPGAAPDLGAEVRALLAPHFQVRHFRKGSLLWREGETEGLLVAMRTGRVKIYRLLPNARSVTLFLFGPGHVFGFLPFIDGGPYPAYAQAIEDVAADVMPRSVLLRLLRADAELAPRLISLLGRRLREAFNLIEGLSTPGAPSRVAGALLALLPDEHDQEPVVLRLPVTAQEFAGAMGIAPETFSRALKRLEDDRILAREGVGRYRVLDLDSLRRAASPPMD